MGTEIKRNAGIEILKHIFGNVTLVIEKKTLFLKQKFNKVSIQLANTF